MPSDLSKSKLKTPRNGLFYALLKGPTFTGVNDGAMSASVTYQIYAEDMGLFFDELMPAPHFAVDETGPYVYKLPSLKLNVRKGDLNTPMLSAVSAVASPFQDDKPIDYFGGDTRTDSYNKYASVDVQFQTNIDALATDLRTNRDPRRFLEPNFSVTVEILGVHPNKNTKAADIPTGSQNPLGAPKTITDMTVPIPKVIPVSERSFRWAWALNPDFNAIFSLLGTVNDSTTIDWVPGGAPEATLLFLGLEGKLQWNWQSDPMGIVTPWDLQYKFAQRQVIDGGEVKGWNHFYDPGQQKWVVLHRGDTDKPLYDSNDFSRKLFQVKAG